MRNNGIGLVERRIRRIILKSNIVFLNPALFTKNSNGSNLCTDVCDTRVI